MDFQVDITIPPLQPPVNYGDKILLTGSCFTEHIGQSLAELKFDVLQNPNGILFDPAAVCHSIFSWIDNRPYRESDLFSLHDIWHSWAHHSRFSHTDSARTLEQINASQQQAHNFLQQADWLIITLGSAFSYRLTKAAAAGEPGNGVANCHRAPAQWFDKHLMSIEEIVAQLDTLYHRLKIYNPGLKILFTISPVRHIRDGVVANNRSKARLIESVHHICDKLEGVYYFPAYELVTDVLRDYRFYDADLVHPNYMATTYVMERFREHCIDPSAIPLMNEIKKIAVARRHKPFHPATAAHRQFLSAHYEKVKMLQEQYPFLPLQEELNYFSGK